MNLISRSKSFCFLTALVIAGCSSSSGESTRHSQWERCTTYHSIGEDYEFVGTLSFQRGVDLYDPAKCLLSGEGVEYNELTHKYFTPVTSCSVLIKRSRGQVNAAWQENTLKISTSGYDHEQTSEAEFECPDGSCTVDIAVKYTLSFFFHYSRSEIWEDYEAPSPWNYTTHTDISENKECVAWGPASKTFVVGSLKAGRCKFADVDGKAYELVLGVGERKSELYEVTGEVPLLLAKGTCDSGHDTSTYH